MEAGVTRLQLAKALRNTGLMFPIDPGADATLGGMAATRASGTTAVRYGTMRENVLGLTVVLADGRVDQDRHARAQVGRRLRPDAPVRRIRRHARHHHRGDAAAASGARSRVGGGLLVRHDAGRRRHGDRHDPARRAGRAHRAARRRADGRDQPLLEDWRTRSRRRCSSSSMATARATSRGRPRPSRRSPTERGGRRFEWATRLEDRERLWQARHNAHYAALALRPGCRSWADRCLRADLPARRLRRRDRRTNTRHASFPVCLVGHAGDGNFHLMYLLEPGRPGGSRPRRDGSTSGWSPARWRWAARAPASTASATARSNTWRPSTATALDVMRAIKRALDPDNRMNPGKVLSTRLTLDCRPESMD